MTRTLPKTHHLTGVLIVMCCSLAFPVYAQSNSVAKAIEDCNHKESKRILSGCGAIIAMGDVKKRILLVAHNRRAVMYLRLGNLDKSIADLTSVVSIDPTKDIHKTRLSAAFALRGQRHVDKKNLHKAISDFEAAKKLQPNNTITQNRLVELYDLRGLEYLLDKNHTEAVASYSKAIELEDGNAELFARRAEAYVGANKIDSAIKDLSRVIWLKPNFIGVYKRLGEIYLLSDRNEEAIAEFSAALKRKPKDTGILLLRALAHEKQKAMFDAEKDYKAVIKLNRRNEEAKEGLVRLKKIEAECPSAEKKNDYALNIRAMNMSIWEKCVSSTDLNVFRRHRDQSIAYQEYIRSWIGYGSNTYKNIHSLVSKRFERLKQLQAPNEWKKSDIKRDAKIILDFFISILPIVLVLLLFILPYKIKGASPVKNNEHG